MNSFKKLSVKFINAVSIFSIVLVFLIVAGVCYQSLLKIDTDEYWEIHSYQVSGNIDILLSDLENMETGQRGYIITGQQSFLAPFNSGFADVNKTFLILQKLTSDNSVQQKNLAQMKPLIDAKITDMQNSISLRTNEGLDAAQAHVLTDKGKQIMDSIRAIVANMQTEEASLLQIRTKDLAQINAMAESIIIWGSIIGFLFYLLVNYIISKFVIGEIVQKPLMEEILKANKELRVLDLAKDEFVSIASHQLRTPLTALKGYTGMLLDGDAGLVNDKQREYLTEIKNANDRMINLITALLNVSRVDLGVFVVEPEPVNLMEVAESVLKESEARINNKKMAVTTNFEKDLPLINVDLNIMRMILQNLLSNAMKYTPSEGKINLDIKKDGSNILISVADTGYGIPANVQSKIFTKMFRADNARVKDPDGTGLGLYIIKETIEKTGGKIWFESPGENKGSTFYVTIPLEGMKKKEGTRRLENK
jgi:Osmosensitive K+ channel histidine kinase